MLPFLTPPPPRLTATTTPLCSAGHADPSFNEVIGKLRRSGLRVTTGRRAMIAVLLHADAPLTLAQLQTAIRPAHVALATLFRSMLRLEEVELVTRTIDLCGTTNWQLNLGRPRTFHLSHRATGQIARLDEDLAAPLRDVLTRLETVLRARGYTQLVLNVAFHSAQPLTRDPASPAPPQLQVA